MSEIFFLVNLEIRVYSFIAISANWQKVIRHAASYNPLLPIGRNFVTLCQFLNWQKGIGRKGNWQKGELAERVNTHTDIPIMWVPGNGDTLVYTHACTKDSAVVSEQ